MNQRLDSATVSPELYKALLGVENYLRANIDPTIFELVKLRASMTNGCAFCVDMHTTDAVAAGESIERIVGLTAWNEGPWYTDAERAALRVTDALTTLGAEGVSDDAWDEARRHFDERQLVDIVGAAGMINLWNRLSIATRNVPMSFRSKNRHFTAAK